MAAPALAQLDEIAADIAAVKGSWVVYQEFLAERDNLAHKDWLSMRDQVRQGFEPQAGGLACVGHLILCITACAQWLWVICTALVLECIHAACCCTSASCFIHCIETCAVAEAVKSRRALSQISRTNEDVCMKRPAANEQ